MKFAQSVLSGWGNYPQASCSRAEPVAPLKDLSDFSGFQHVIARGMGRSYGDASLAPDEKSVVVATRWQNKFISFDCQQGLVTAQAGTSFQEILDLAIPQGWFLPVTPGTRFVSLGGALASNVHGKNHHRCGAIVNFVTELEVLTEQGVLQCSPSQRADLFYATMGGYGLTGLIQKATLRLKRIETARITARLIKVPNLDAAIAVCEALDPQYEYSVTWLDALATGEHLGRGIVMLGNHTPLGDLKGAAAAHPLENRWHSRFTAPRHFPGWVLNRASNQIFNFAYGHKFLGPEWHGLTRFESWFYPMDGVAEWNRFYGRSGFVEYQCALPTASAAAGMRQMLELIHKYRLGSFLAVYKKIGDDGVTMPFAMPGYTLAMDFGVRHEGLFPMMDELDQIVISHGGKVYLSKDARLGPAAFRQMYPEYPCWREVVERYAPQRRFQSRLSQRLQL